VLILKPPQHFHLLLFLARRLPHLLLPLIIHHLLHHTPRLPIQIAQLAVLRRDLRRVDLGSGGYDVRPPFHLVDLVEVEGDLFAGRGGFERPCALVDVDLFCKVTLV